MALTSTFATAPKPLRADDLACFRGGRMVFDHLSFEVKPGELLYLRGKNGSGKSTLLRLIAGFLRAQGGTLKYGDEAWAHGDAALSEALIYAGHDNALKPVLTLRENARELMRLMTGRAVGDVALAEAAEVFALTGLLDQPVRYFSSGQRHRSNLMRFAYLSRPLWLMDEPTVGLDAENRDALAALMRKHLDMGGMIIAATHDPIGVEGAMIDMRDYQPEIELEEEWL
ncbi:heme ABC exporter ATP-binding protein CcmA [Kordiimonas lipolytica]|uniref:Heme ABC exporter ATP-binding protein CcmA n=1 Tax=Kordiimonas lipolytica TaxID=1662421 RepID=A0ABV8U5N6_9PROT|nr:heme ABC exporter ATP-binding protein CcmA [Kordiimonas lipolytica]